MGRRRHERITLPLLMFLFLAVLGLYIWQIVTATQSSTSDGKGLDVITTACTGAPPHTTLTCSAANALQLLFCDLDSNKTQIGNIYLCVASTWTFFGAINVQGNGTAGAPGIGVYATQCAGGPPPTTTTGPSYVCDANFNLNMILCNLQSLNGNAGVIYECSCAPTCGWTKVGDLNGVITIYREGAFNFPFVNTHNVWNNLGYISLLTVGQYYCTVEGQMTNSLTTQSCPLYYGVSSVPASNIWLYNSNRVLNLPPVTTGTYIQLSIVTSMYLQVSSAPETLYLTGGIGTGTTGCAQWQTGVDIPITMTCIKTA